jgi:hypothetical protein
MALEAVAKIQIWNSPLPVKSIEVVFIYRYGMTKEECRAAAVQSLTDVLRPVEVTDWSDVITYELSNEIQVLNTFNGDEMTIRFNGPAQIRL